MSRCSLKVILFMILWVVCTSCEEDISEEDIIVEAPFIGLLFDSFEDTIVVEKTDIIATSGNNILKIVGNELAMSNDLGKTWKYLENIIGAIFYVHWFKDKTCMICGRTRAYWVDSSFSELYESALYDYDGRVISDNSPHFFNSLHGHNEDMTIAGKEVYIWSDYFGEVDGYISRIWFTDDNGKTIWCICKNGSTKTIDGQLINCRHFHDCVIREGYDEIYITSGDVGDQCMLIKGQYIEGEWYYTLLGKGPLYKFDGVYVEEPYLFLLCDYNGYGQTGIMKVPIAEVQDFSKYEYVYTSPENLPVLLKFQVGKYSFITYDGSVKGKLLFSYDSKPYRDLPIMFEMNFQSVSYVTGPNNDGLVLIRAGNGYNITDLKLNGTMYNLSDGMRSAGFKDFGAL